MPYPSLLQISANRTLLTYPLTLPYLTLPYPTLPHLTLRCLTLLPYPPYLTRRYFTLPHSTLPYPTLPYPTLPYPPLPSPGDVMRCGCDAQGTSCLHILRRLVPPRVARLLGGRQRDHNRVLQGQAVRVRFLRSVQSPI